ncbi:protein phosphatase 2C domain-containing protein [Streptomyces sp. VB1]|uniref:protein phosphatase 2C domain-containing protein n=1 Tax=Streptomyces sp. VB1 TaxID=2986803 RepID=UPI0022418F8E|nr:protein phosphatase 2C domain-containing protein [Streptomyces sp. VB1]UZI27776.1 protein phosphatase 2C domain-containing protein [Streptomyces sp. VB1]
MSAPEQPLWETLEHSVRGVNKQINQDWYAAEGSGTEGDPLILSVADGHGSAVHARSEIGARCAVDLFGHQARTFAQLARAEGPDGAPSLSWLMNYARNELPRQLVAAWQERVLAHWDHNRGTVDPAAEPPRKDQKLLLYGATLVGAVLTPRMFAAWQLGDGELTVTDADGAIALPLAPVEADLGDETESLCSRQAWKMIRVHWAPVVAPDRTPRMIALSTDGLSKSFASDEGFTQFMTGLDQRLSKDGRTDGVRDALPGWLAEAARYSGDDTTLVAARRPDLIPADDSAAADERRSDA